jgi:hypothetical protein
MRIFLTVLGIMISFCEFAQTDYRSIDNRKLNPSKFDLTTEKIFVYIKPKAVLYFKNSDILNYLDSLYKHKSDFMIKTIDLYDTLKSIQQKIVITDLNYSYGNEDRSKIIKKQKVSDKILKINEEFEYIGIDLVLSDKFMVFSNKDKNFIFDGLKAVQSNGFYGTTYLEFILPDKTCFYSMVTALGE